MIVTKNFPERKFYPTDWGPYQSSTLFDNWHYTLVVDCTIGILLLQTVAETNRSVPLNVGTEKN
jgi:hypothetical protein